MLIETRFYPDGTPLPSVDNPTWGDWSRIFNALLEQMHHASPRKEVINTHY